MALKVTINAEGGGIVIENVGKANELYLVGLEDVRLSQKDATRIQLELESPEHLIQTVLNTADSEVSINGIVSATPAAAIADFGAVVEAARSAGGGGGGFPDISKRHSFRNNNILIGDSGEEIVLFAIKRTGAQDVTITEIQVNAILESNDYAEIRYHKNPAIVGGGTLTYSPLPDNSLLTVAGGDDSSPSKTQVGTDGVNVQVLGYADEKNYGAFFLAPLSITLANNTDEHVFTAICSGNDTKVKSSFSLTENIE